MRGWLQRPLGAVLVAAAIALGGGGIYVVSTSGGGGAPAGTANLWIDSSPGSCTWRVTPQAYVDGESCSGTSQAYTTANTNSPTSAATVGIRAGSYGDQVTPDSARTGADIAFVTSNGAVTFTELDVHGDKSSWTASGGSLTLATGGLETSGPTTRLIGATFDGVSAQGGGITCPSGCDAAWYMFNAQDLTFKNGEICCGKSTSSVTREGIQVAAGLPTAGTTVDNVTIDNNYIHEWVRGDAVVHTECAFLMSIQNWTITRNHFANCATYNMSIGRLAGNVDPNNVTIANNTFEPTDDIGGPGQESGTGYAMVLDHVNTRYGNLVIRNNSFAWPIQFETADVPDSTGFDQTVVESNIIRGQASCAVGAPTPTYRFNVLDGGACGSNSTVVADVRTGWTTTTGLWNFHLQAGAAAIGKASTTAGQFTTTDIGGFPRDGAPDAGAYEFGSGS